MTFKRKEQKLNKAEKLARKKLLKFVLIIALLLLFCILFLFKYEAELQGVSFTSFICSNTDLALFVSFIYLLCLILIYFLSRKAYINEAYDELGKQYSRQLAEKFLIPLNPTDIILRNTTNEVYKDYILGLQKDGICKFYVILDINEHNTIFIYSKFKEDNKERLFDIITKEEFTTYCELPEDD